jgi:hypothetical protein
MTPLRKVSILLFAAVMACNTPGAPTPAPKPETEPAPPDKGPKRLVAIGDLHGDFEATKEVLRLAGAIDPSGRWIGGDLVVVQTGDQLDRGDGEVEILDLLDRLTVEAKEAGGAMVILNGNHEVMNVQGDMRYVTPGGFTAFDGVEGLDLSQPELQRHPPAHRARVAAFAPGGPYARRLAQRDIIAVVGDTVFAHGGVTAEHARAGIDSINTQSRQWMLGQGAQCPESLRGAESPIWTRVFSDEAMESDCDALDETLEALGVKRMVVGHTVQRQGITSACEGKVWRIDVGMAKHYGGKPQCLEILATGEVRRVFDTGPPEPSSD